MKLLWNPVGRRILRLDLEEKLLFTWAWPQRLAGFLLLLYFRLKKAGPGAALEKKLVLLGALYRNINHPSIDRFCLRELRALKKRFGIEAVRQAFIAAADRGAKPEMLKKLRDSVTGETGMVRQRLLILKTPSGSGQGFQKGVLVISFTAYFPYFRQLFDFALLRRYHLVLEPSWVGFFVPEILEFDALPHPVYVQGNEERDMRLLQSLGGNLLPVPTAANGWVHPGIFRPLPGTEKRFDVAVVSGWSDYKRYPLLFRALKALKRKRERAGKRPLRLVCVGNPVGRTREGIEAEADYFGVRDQLEFRENVTAADINVLFNQSRATVLFSRKEGSNRSIIEAMFAGIPAFIREGLNYGCRYPYLNRETGGFYRDRELPALLESIADGRFDGLKPRDWVLRNWSPEASTRMLEKAIFGTAEGRLAVKVDAPEFEYLHPEDSVRFGPAYSELREFLR